ncbi:MAG TPA: class I SAM-dependent methyltransferase [Pyrinomonadaceae bacterium]|jgi:16S rRNA G966 N2-methylase RsmD|nr:class I SAM-dependent methyltransferase [Pyrinomonadaceae bacterium]
MFEVRIFNPFKGGMDTIATLAISSQSEAAQRAEQFLSSNGIKIGEIVAEGSEERHTIIGLPDQESVATDNGGFWFVANHVYFIFKAIKEELGIKVDSFVDLGCGPGNILICARNLLGATRLTGVEIDIALVEQAKRNTESLGAEITAEIIQADLLEWRPAVNNFDMVYAYDPIRDLAIRQRFHDRLAEWLRDGQHVFYHRIVGEMPVWLEKIDIPNYDVPCLYTFAKNKV